MPFCSEKKANFVDNALLFNCSLNGIKHATASNANTAAGPDGVSFSTIKEITLCILLPFMITSQQPFAQGIFPASLKSAKAIPIYKGKEECTDAFISTRSHYRAAISRLPLERAGHEQTVISLNPFPYIYIPSHINILYPACYAHKNKVI